jgi:hypothetical protein
VTVTAGGGSVEESGMEGGGYGLNYGGEQGWQRILLIMVGTLLYFLHFHQSPLPPGPTKLGAVNPSAGQLKVLTHADPVWSILSPALGIFSPAQYTIELCQL